MSSKGKNRQSQSHLSVPHGLNSAEGGSRRSSTSSAPGEGDTGPAKPKITKSRNGCTTCKAKRLKCDETKPTCQMCEKRNVECGGYKKDFKFKSFDETSFAEGSSSKAKDIQAVTDSSTLPVSPARSSDSSSPTQFRNGQLVLNTEVPRNPASVGISANQEPNQDPPPAHLSFYEQPENLSHLQIPDFLSQTPGLMHLPATGDSGVYTAYDQAQDGSIDHATIEAMLAQDLSSSLSHAAWHPSALSPGYGQTSAHSAPSTPMIYGQTQTQMMDMPPSMPQEDVVPNQQMNLPMLGGYWLDAAGYWHSYTPEQSLDIDEASLQQAMDDWSTSQQQLNEESENRSNTRSSSYGGNT